MSSYQAMESKEEDQKVSLSNQKKKNQNQNPYLTKEKKNHQNPRNPILTPYKKIQTQSTNRINQNQNPETKPGAESTPFESTTLFLTTLSCVTQTNI